MKWSALILSSLVLLSSCAHAIKLAEGEHYMGSSTIKLDKGGDLKSSELSSYVKGPDIYYNNVNKEGEDNLKNHLKYLGYYNADVTSEVEFTKKNANITYFVHQGERIKIDSIRFNVDGDNDFKYTFERDMDKIQVKKGDYLSEAALAEEAKRSSEFFRNNGYYGFSSDAYAFVADTISTQGSLLLDYNIFCDNPPYTIGDVTIAYPESVHFRDTVLRGLLNIRPGMQYSEKRVNSAYNRLANLHNFNNVVIEMTPRDSSSVVDCNVKMQPGALQSVRVNLEASVNASGLLSLSPQLTYSHNNIFHGGEKLTVGFSANLQYRPSDKTTAQEYTGTVGVTFPKFLGLGYKNFKGSAIPKTDVKISYSYQNRPEYNRTILSLNYTYSGTHFVPGNYLTYQFTPFKLNAVQLPFMSEDFAKTLQKNPMLWYSYMDHLDAGVNATLYLSDQSGAMPKTTFRYLRASVDLSGNLLSLFDNLMKENEYGEKIILGLPYTRYAKTEIQLGYTFRFGKENKAALALRALGGIGYAYGNSESMPFEQQFYCGGANSMRGWNARCLGPGSTSSSYEEYYFPCQAGDMKLEADIEARFPIVWKVEGAAFVETGNVWCIQHPNEEFSDSMFKFSTFAQQLAADWGIGLRLNIDFLVIRLDMGMRLRDPAKLSENNGWRGPKNWFESDGYAIHFGVGYPF